jgi:hypothetical protein
MAKSHSSAASKSAKLPPPEAAASDGNGPGDENDVEETATPLNPVVMEYG